MNKEFKITSGNVEVRFDEPQFDTDGWLEQYTLSFQSPHLNLSMVVENPPYGISPADFFQDMADQWSGWQGEKSWSAMEGEYSIDASMSRTGHASVRFTANVYYPAGEWGAIASFDIEAGQLERLAKEAKRFFYSERL